MSAGERVARMLTLVPWLRERPGASLAEAAAVVGVEASTIRRDLRDLDLCDLPGLGGGSLFEVELWGDRVIVRLAEGLMRPFRPTPREALHLVVTASTVAGALGEEIPALASALGKVREAVGLPRAVADSVSGPQGPWLRELRAATTEGRRVRLTYRGRSDAAPRQRVVDPWTLRGSGGAWYLQGHDREAGALRTFRLDRVVDLEVLPEPRAHEPPPEPPPEPRYVPGPGDLPVELVAEPEARWLTEHVEVDEQEDLGGGRLRLRLHTDAPDHIAGLLLAAGPGVEIIDPPALADRVAELARGALEAYDA